MTITKLHMGETYENDKNQKGIWMGSSCWAVKNESGKVVTFGNDVEMLFNTKTAATESLSYLSN